MDNLAFEGKLKTDKDIFYESPGQVKSRAAQSSRSAQSIAETELYPRIAAPPINGYNEWRQEP
jgi:hypothetical protein